MRLALGLFVLCLAAAPASAQSAFLSSCMTSARGEGALPVAVAQQICGCTEAAALDAGETAASLDRYQALAATLDSDASGMAAGTDPPEWAVATSSVLMESMGGCLTALREQATMASAEPRASKPGATAPETAAAKAPTPPRTLPQGLRTGDGGGQVQAVQQGNGAAVRILG